MSATRIFKFTKNPVFVGGVVFIALLFLTQALTYQRYLLLKDAEIDRLVTQANLTKERLQTVMASNFSATQTLSFITEKYGKPHDFDSVAKKLIAANKCIDVVELVEGGIIKYAYPLKGNESIIGFDIVSDSIRSSGAFKARETGEFFIAGPIKLKQGGVAIVARQPIFINNNFWGFAATITKLSTLLAAAGIDTVASSKGIYYQLSKVNATNGEEEFFLPNQNSMHSNFSVPVFIPNGEWKLYVVSKEGVPLNSIFTFALLGIILSLTGGLLAWFISSQPQKLKKLVAEKTVQIDLERQLSDSVINSLPGVFYVAGLDGKLIRWNKNFETVTGYPGSEIATMRVIDFVDLDEKQSMLQKKQLAIAKGVSDVEANILSRNRKKTPFYLTSLLVNYNDQAVLMGVGIDITERKKAELALIESESRYRSLIEQATDTICIADSDLNFIDINSSGCRMFGYSREEFLSLSLTSVLFEEEIPEAPARIAALKELGAVTRERRFKRRDGVAIELEINAKILDDGRVLIFARDISARKKAELALIESEEQYRSLIENSADIIMRVDLNEKVQFINYTGGGFSKADIIGKSAFNFVQPEFHDLVRQTHQRVIKERVTLGYETVALGQDNVMRWFQTNVGPIIIHDKVVGITLITRDITERKNVEAEVVREKTLSESLINSLPGVFYLYDESGTFLRWNKNFEIVTGYTGEELKFMHPLNFFEGHNKTLLKERIKEVFEKGESEVEALFKNRQGVEVPYYFNGLAITYENKRCLIGVGIDITARKEAEEKILQSQIELRQLSAHLQTVREEERGNIAREIHDELGQQLTGLKMDTAWLNKKLTEADKTVHEKLEGMLALIDETVKTVRRISSELRPGILDDMGLIAALEWQSGEFEKRSGIVCSFNTDVEELELSSNLATGIFRVYQETLTNVSRHAQATEVNATLAVAGNIVVLVIADNGKGFDTTVARNKKNLGLVGMKERAIMLGGTLSIESETGKGTKVVLRIPLG